MAAKEERSTATIPPLPTQGGQKGGQKYHLPMKGCICYSSFTCASVAVCVMSGAVGARWEQPVESDIWHAGVAILLVMSLAITEICIAVGGASNFHITECLRDEADNAAQVHLPGAYDAWLTLMEYLAKMAVGVYMYTCSGGLAHVDSLALDGARPVYMGRFAQWSFAVPVLVLITNCAFIESPVLLIQRSWPSCWAAFSYVWAAWLMEVTPYHFIRWPMMVLSLSGAVFVFVDQFHLAGEYRSARCYNSKMALLWYSKIMDAFYAAIFLCGRFGLISPTTEHIIYPYCDATCKVFHGALLAMIRSREGACEISLWCKAAVSAGNDLKYLLREAKIPTLTIDLSGNVVQWNESIAQLTGLQEASVQGKALLELSEHSSKDDLSKALAQKISAFKTGPVPPDCDSGLVELAILTNKQQYRNIPPVRKLAMTLVPKRNTVGELEGVTAIGQDLSEISDLKMVQERRNALMAMLGHEIRSPLHGMMGLSCALLENPQSKPFHRQLGMVKGCTARLLDLVNNIMDLAQSEKRKLGGISETKPTAHVDFPSMVEEAMVMIGNSVDKANNPLLKPGVRLVNNSVGTKVPVVRGDAHKCTQLLYNLMTNAAKFTDRGSISVTFRHLPEEKRLEIDVTDTGKGISKEGVKRIFLPFEQENSGDCRSYQGIGLGLSVCKEIAELHDGSLRVESEVGKGSTFTFSLPCDGDLGSVEVKSAADCFAEMKVQQVQPMHPSTDKYSPPSESAPVRGVPSESASAAKPLILSVDDDDVNQEVVKNTLSESYEVACAMNGHESLVYLDERVKSKLPFPELILLDIQMPGMTGFQVLEQVRTQYGAKGSSLPVMMLSAKAPPEKTAIQSYDSGATDFIPKPFNPEILRKKVMAIFNLKVSGVRLAGVDIAVSEACKRVKQFEMEAIKAAERSEDLVAKLSCSREQTALALDKAKNFDLEVASLKRVIEDQKAQICKLSTACHKPENLQQPTLSTLTQLQLKDARKEHSPALAERTRHSCQGSDNTQMLKANVALNSSVVVRLLVSRLRVCGKSAIQCQQLLKACWRNEDTYSQVNKFKQITHVALSELAMLENVASNIGGIVHLMDDGGGSTECETPERQSDIKDSSTGSD